MAETVDKPLPLIVLVADQEGSVEYFRDPAALAQKVREDAGVLLAGPQKSGQDLLVEAVVAWAWTAVPGGALEAGPLTLVALADSTVARMTVTVPPPVPEVSLTPATPELTTYCEPAPPPMPAARKKLATAPGRGADDEDEEDDPPAKYRPGGYGRYP